MSLQADVMCLLVPFCAVTRSSGGLGQVEDGGMRRFRGLEKHREAEVPTEVPLDLCQSGLDVEAPHQVRARQGSTDR